MKWLHLRLIQSNFILCSDQFIKKASHLLLLTHSGAVGCVCTEHFICGSSSSSAAFICYIRICFILVGHTFDTSVSLRGGFPLKVTWHPTASPVSVAACLNTPSITQNKMVEVSKTVMWLSTEHYTVHSQLYSLWRFCLCFGWENSCRWCQRETK